jgi:hypothetical protein
MSDENLEGFNSKPASSGSKYPITPDADPAPSQVNEDATEVIQSVDEAPVTETPVDETPVTEVVPSDTATEPFVSDEISPVDQAGAPMSLPIINTTYVSPSSESTEPAAVEETPIIDPDSLIQALPEEKVERKFKLKKDL